MYEYIKRTLKLVKSTASVTHIGFGAQWFPKLLNITGFQDFNGYVMNNHRLPTRPSKTTIIQSKGNLNRKYRVVMFLC